MSNFICNGLEISLFSTIAFPYSYVITKVTITFPNSEIKTYPGLRLTDNTDY